MECVYVLTNPSIPGMVKIGQTDRTAYERAREISTGTGIPTAFTVAYYAETTDFKAARWLERRIHDALATHRVNRSREFFAMTVADAIVYIETIGHNSNAIAITSTEIATKAERIRAEYAAREERIRAERAAAYAEQQRRNEEAAAKYRAEQQRLQSARREAAEHARVERVRAEAEQAEQNAAIRAQREAAARIEAARISRNKKMVWGSLVLVACFLFGAYEDNKRQKEQERYARSEQARAEQAERYAAIRAKREAAERARAEKARADALRIEQACAPINVRPLSSFQPSPWDDVAKSPFAREYLPSRKMSISDFAALSFAEREKLAIEYEEARAKEKGMTPEQRKRMEALRDLVVYADNGGRAPNQTGRTFSNWSDASAAMHKPAQDALLAAQQRRQQMEACNRALVLASQNR